MATRDDLRTVSQYKIEADTVPSSDSLKRCATSRAASKFRLEEGVSRGKDYNGLETTKPRNA
eukprot:1548617-Prymnesium_polylepis.1